MKKMGCGQVVLLRCLESCRREKVHMHDNAEVKEAADTQGLY